jgi:hypothetical protein
VWWQPLEASSIASLADLYRALERLRKRPDMCLVRGTAIDPTAPAIRRKKLGDEAGLRDGDREWMCCDLDTLDVPVELREVFAGADGIRLAGAWARGLLPSWLATAGCVAQWSASAGRDGYARAKLHLWFWFTRPVCCDSIERYCKTVPLLDPSTCRVCQPIYTADPIIEDGWQGPMVRLALLDGPLAEPPADVLCLVDHEAVQSAAAEKRAEQARKWAEASLYQTGTAAQRSLERRFQGVLRRHLDAVAGTGEGGRHAAIVSAARAVIATGDECRVDIYSALEQLRSVAQAKLPSNRQHEPGAIIAHALRHRG